MANAAACDPSLVRSARNAELNPIPQPERGRDGEARTAFRMIRHLALHHLTAGQDYLRCNLALFSNLATAFDTAEGRWYALAKGHVVLQF